MSYDLQAAPLLLCRTGSMTLYDGDLHTWSGTHAHPIDTGEANEAWNFARTPGGYVYGYVQNGWNRRLNIDRLGAHRVADRVEGITIAWCSRRPSDGMLVIHGWYENAVAFREQFKRPDGKAFRRWMVPAYFMTAAEDARLLPPDLRRHVVPSHQPRTMGHSDLLYVDSLNPSLAATIRRYLVEARIGARSPAPAPGVPPDHTGWGGGESARHLALKIYVRDNPRCLDLGLKRRGQEEYVLPSLDGVDVLFETAERLYAVEVKPERCGDKEHERGLYQCVKYRALLEAQALDAGVPRPCTAVLVTEEPLSENHRATAKRFKIVHRHIRLPTE